MRIEIVQPILRGVELRAADRRGPVQQLALQVAEVDTVEADDADAAAACRGEVHRGGRAEAAGADAQHASGLQLLLPVEADLRHDQVPRGALDLLSAEVGRRRPGGSLKTRPYTPPGRRHDAERIPRLCPGRLLLE